jgi:signal transduction histidine kinase
MPFKPSLRLQTKLTLVILLLVCLMVAIFLSVALSIYQAEEQRAFELRAVSVGSLLAESIRSVASSDILFTQAAFILKNVRQQAHVLYVYAYDYTGKILADGTRDNPRYSPNFNTIPNDPLHGNAVKAEKPLIQYKYPEFLAPGNVLDIAHPIVVAGEKLGGVRIGFTLQPVQQKIAEARKYTLLLGLAFALAGGILSALISRQLVRPVRDLVLGTQLIASGNLDVQIRPSSRDELGILADSFGRMAVTLKENQTALRRKVVETRTLYEVGQEITGQVALEPTLRLIVDRARAILQAEASLLALRQDGSDIFAMQAFSGPVTEALTKLSFSLGEGLGGRVVAAGSPMMVGDYLVEFHDSPFLVIVREAGIRSSVAVPLKAHDRVIGVLYVGSREPQRFGEEEQQLLSALADQAAIAIENAKLYEDVRRHAGELEAKVEARTTELQEVNRELHEASRHKSQFLANMSHELRTPLNAILGYTELIVDNVYGEVPDKIRDVLQRVQNSGRHLLGLINDVLDLSKIEAGQFTLSLSDYSMQQVVQTVVVAVESLAAEKKLTLKVNVPPDLPPGKGDERRITQVLLNLVGNAIKFTEAGEVRIRAMVSDGQFLVAVSDTGPGISEADQQRIFEEFQQGDGSGTRPKGGTGLGLSIAKRIIEMQGGYMWVESTLGKGSTFWFALPVRVEQ